MVASQNGWKVLAANELGHAALPGGSITCNPAVAPIFTHLGTRYHNEVQPLVWPGCWGWADRDVRGSTDISNHASGTAMDLNAPLHPLGTSPMANYNSVQISNIHQIVAFYEGVIRWGGDYTGRKDGMHFEINDGVTEEQVAHIVAKIGGTPVPTPVPVPVPQPATDFPYAHDECFGLVSDPSAKVHGGINEQEKVWVRQIQVKLQQLGFAPAAAGWSDGLYEQPTVDAVAAWQHARMPGTTIFGQVWFDDWAALIQDRYPAPPPPPPANDGSSLPTLTFGDHNDTVAHLQAFLNAYNWRPALPLIGIDGIYGKNTAAVLHAAGRQRGVQGDADGRNFGPHFKAAFWAIGFRG